MDKQEVVDFFLRGVNEPVALEIPISDRYKWREVVDALKESGVNSAVLVGGPERGPCAILTPVLLPEDLRATYDLIVAALKSKSIDFMYPYVRDIQHLPKLKYEEQEDTDIGQTMIDAAMASGEVITYWGSTQDGQDFIQEMQQSGHLFAGAKISDPYTVASDYFKRDTRMATPSFGYAVGYAITTVKSLSAHNQTTKHGIPFGFLYEYERADGQPFFGNAGIETGGRASRITPVARDVETPVNRFTNPCVGRWLVWQSKKEEISLFKIPENDPQWEELLSRLQTVMHFDSPQKAWIEHLRKSGDKPQSIVDGVEPGKMAEYAKKKIPEIMERATKAKEVAAKITELIAEINKIVFVDFDAKLSKLKTTIETENLKGKRFDEIVKQLDSESKSLIEYTADLLKMRKGYDELCATADKIIKQWADNDELKESIQKLQDKIAEKDKEFSDRNKDISYVEMRYTSHRIFVEKQMVTYVLDHHETVRSGSLRQLSSTQRMDVMKQIFEKPWDKLELALRIYSIAPEKERIVFFEYFEGYVSADKRNVSKLKRVIKEFGEDLPEEIVELSRGKSLFVDHIKRAQEKINFMRAQQELQQKIGVTEITETIDQGRE